jgi:hypothetical protein
MASAPPTSALSAIQLAVLQRPRPPTPREAEDPVGTRAAAAPSPITGGRGRILDITV